MQEVKVGLVGAKFGGSAEALHRLNEKMRERAEEAGNETSLKVSLKEEKATKDKVATPTKKAILDIELYVPYQSAFDAILDNTFDDQPLVVQALQGWMAEAFRRYAQKNKAYLDIVLTCAKKLQLKSEGKPFGQIMPKEQRPNPNHIFKTLVKLKQLPKPHVLGEVEYYVVSDFNERIKKEFFYPAIEDALPGLMSYLKKNKIKLLLGNDFVFALPKAVRENPQFKEAWDRMDSSVTDSEGYAIHTATAMHKFKFI